MKSLVGNQKTFFNTGQTRSIAFRKIQLKKLHQLLVQNESRLYEAIYSDFKKSEFDTYATELGLIYHEIQVASHKLNRWASVKRARTNIPNLPGKSFIIPEPYGVVLVIGAWNYPYQLSLIPVISALAAGNAVVLKPGELSSASSQIMAQLINQSFDKEYLFVMEGGVEETTELLKQPFDKVFFTGSTKVGKIVYEACARNLVPVTLELGGKSPAFVFPDTDIDVTARRLVWAKFLNGGQTCIAPDYLLVHEEVKERLLSKMVHYIQSYYGENPIQSSALPRIINQRNFNRLVELIDPKKVFYGGHSNLEELFIEPTILTDITFDDLVMQDEIFGPLLPVITFNQPDEIIQQVKKLEKPLALYVFTRSKPIQQTILNQISFGGGCINDAIMHIANGYLPFGGVGGSGTGNYHEESGFRAFSHYKSILKKGFWFEPLFKYPPYTQKKLTWVKRFI